MTLFELLQSATEQVKEIKSYISVFAEKLSKYAIIHYN